MFTMWSDLPYWLFCYKFTAESNLLQSPTVEECWKSVGIWQSYWPEYSGTFFWPTVASCLFFSLCILHLGLVARSSVNLNCRLTQQCRHDNSYSRDTWTNSNDDDDDCWCVKRLMQKSCTALCVLVRCEDVRLQRWSEEAGAERWIAEIFMQDSRPFGLQRRKPNVQTYCSNVMVHSADGG